MGELKGEDHFRFLRAYTAGLQEYIEALSFYHYLCYGRLIQWKEVQDDLTFRRKYRSRNKNPSGGSKTSTSADSESTLAVNSHIRFGDDDDDDHKNDEKVASTVEKEVGDDTEVTKDIAALTVTE